MKKGKANVPDVVEDVDAQQLAHFVTTIKTPEAQVGENIISALQHDETVAVLTTVVRGPNGEQRIISAALDPNTMEQVQKLLMTAQETRVSEEPCVGFHCLTRLKDKAEPAEKTS